MSWDPYRSEAQNIAHASAVAASSIGASAYRASQLTVVGCALVAIRLQHPDLPADEACLKACELASMLEQTHRRLEHEEEERRWGRRVDAYAGMGKPEEAKK